MKMELIDKINKGLPSSFWEHYRALVYKRETGVITSEELEVLIALSDQAEAHSAERSTWLTELSQQQQVPVRTLMAQLGIRPISVSVDNITNTGD
jgi:hypothetical protein